MRSKGFRYKRIIGLFNKILNRMSEENNGVVTNLLYELKKNNLRYIQPNILASIEFITNENCVKVLEVINDESFIKSFQGHLLNQKIGIFAIYKETLGYAWADIGEKFNLINNYKKIDNLVKIKDDEAFIHICRTSEKYKGNNIYPFLLAQLSYYLFSHYHVERILIDTDDKNISSQRGISKAGFKLICLIISLKLFGFTVFSFHKIIAEDSYGS